MMRPTLLLFAAFAIQIFAQECKEKKSLILKDGLKMKCRRGKWIPIKSRSGPSGPPCEDDSSLLDQCSNDQGHCHQYTDKGVKMDKDCPGTCGSCDSCRCQDASQWHAYCPFWAQYCDSPGVLGTWMGDNCRKTCNRCKCGCCSYKGKKHGLGAVIPLAGQCGALVCEEGLVAGPSTLLPGASLHNVSHPEELTLSFKSLFPGSDCCILPADAEDRGTVFKNQSMVQEGWSGRLNKDGMAVQATCCHGTLSVPLEDAVLWNMRTTTTSSSTTTADTATTLFAACDDILKVYLDGVLTLETGFGDWGTANTIPVPSGTKVVGLECEDLSGAGGGHGIVASTASGIVTDGSWSCSSKNVQGWSEPGFTDTNADFSSAKSGNQYSSGPPAGIAREAKSIWGPSERGFAFCKIALSP